MFVFGSRLREERDRLGLTQDQAATAGGIAKRTYCFYESGEREPGADFLNKISSVGFDVAYIISGIRMPAPAPQPPNEVNEPGIEYRALTPTKARIVDLLDGMEDDGINLVQDIAAREKQRETLMREHAEMKFRKAG